MLTFFIKLFHFDKNVVFTSLQAMTKTKLCNRIMGFLWLWLQIKLFLVNTNKWKVGLFWRDLNLLLYMKYADLVYNYVVMQTVDGLAMIPWV